MNDITTFQEQIDSLKRQQIEQMRMSLLDFEYFTKRCREAEVQIEFLGFCLAVILGVLCGTTIALLLVRFNIL